MFIMRLLFSPLHFYKPYSEKILENSVLSIFNSFLKSTVMLIKNKFVLKPVSGPTSLMIFMLYSCFNDWVTLSYAEGKL